MRQTSSFNKVFLLVGVFISTGVLAQIPEGYVALSALEKQDVLWQNITNSPYTRDELLTNQTVSETPTTCEMFSVLSPGHLSGAFGVRSCPFSQTAPDGNWDEMPHGRKKLLHPLGAAAKVSWIPSETLDGSVSEEHLKTDPASFTGIFASGGVGILRVSHGAGPGKSIPGMGLKILVDGRPSVNFHVMYRLEGQPGNWNFFENEFSNIVAPQSFMLKALQIPFGLAISRLYMDNGPEGSGILPLEEAAAVTSAGETIANFHAPYEVFFTPTEEARSLMDPNDSTDLRVLLMDEEKFKPGLVLYTISARERDSQERVELGVLRLDSPMVSSSYNDRSLFFPHQKRLPATQ